jgi:hypothetical protein
MLGATSSGMSHQLREIYSICKWNVATHEWKVHNGKIEIEEGQTTKCLSFVCIHLCLNQNIIIQVEIQISST